MKTLHSNNPSAGEDRRVLHAAALCVVVCVATVFAAFFSYRVVKHGGLLVRAAARSIVRARHTCRRGAQQAD